MADEPRLLIAYPPPPSPARTRPPSRAPLRVGLVQQRWHPDPAEHEAALGDGIAVAAAQGARIVCLQELTLSPYFAITPDGPQAAGATPEELLTGPTFRFATGAARRSGVHVHASLYERSDGSPDESSVAQPDDSGAAQPDDSGAARSGEAGCRAGGKPEGEAGCRAGCMLEAARAQRDF